MSNPSSRKVFGIGLNKTGTTTLGQCGRILGLRCTSCDRTLLEDFRLNSDLSRTIQVVEANDLFEDWPWPLLYRELDRLFPGSKFILTVRSCETRWLKSISQHSLRTNPAKHCRKLAYGFSYPYRHEQEYLDFYRTHNQNVREYFADREEDFLEVCWENGDGFEKLCAFLGLPDPGVRVPHANKGSEQHPSLFRVATNRILSLFVQ